MPTQVTYFQDLKNGQVDAVKYTEGIGLKPQDKISIIVKSKNPEISNLFNLPYITGYVGESTTTGSTTLFLRLDLLALTSSSTGLLSVMIAGAMCLSTWIRLS